MISLEAFAEQYGDKTQAKMPQLWEHQRFALKKAYQARIRKLKAEVNALKLQTLKDAVAIGAEQAEQGQFSACIAKRGCIRASLAHIAAALYRFQQLLVQ